MGDPVTAYAEQVTGGAIVASRLVAMACARHLRDLTEQAARGLVWKPEKAQTAIDFFAEVLFLPENTDAGDVIDEEVVSPEPRPFVLESWQQFVVGSLCGWYTVQGFRRFREAYIETAKGSGKTPLGAGIMLYLLVADGQRGAQVFLAAVTREQAGIAWRDVLAMVDASPELKALLEPGRRANQLEVVEDKSFLRPVSSEKRGLDGKRVHGALVDELHEHATAVVVNKMRAGTKGQRNALIVKTTNSGYDRTSVCWHHHEHSRQVLEGSVTNDSWFAFVCGLDPCPSCQKAGKWFPSDECSACDSWRIEGPHWRKANPNLGVSLPWQYVRERVAQATAMPSEVSDVLRFNFCVWTQAVSHAIDMQRWMACEDLPSDEELRGRPCFGGLDLGQSDDFSAWVRLWILDEGRVAVKARFWLPQAALDKYPNRPYEVWRRAGSLTITEGDTTDYGRVQADVLADCQADGVREVAYDKRFAEQMAQNLIGAGVTMIDQPQGEWLHEALVRKFELITNGRLCHGHNEILTWMASNYVIRRRGERMRPDKDKAGEKIDGQVALDMAIARWVRQPVKTEPQYQMFFAGATR